MRSPGWGLAREQRVKKGKCCGKLADQRLYCIQHTHIRRLAHRGKFEVMVLGRWVRVIAAPCAECATDMIYIMKSHFRHLGVGGCEDPSWWILFVSGAISSSTNLATLTGFPSSNKGWLLLCACSRCTPPWTPPWCGNIWLCRAFTDEWKLTILQNSELFHSSWPLGGKKLQVLLFDLQNSF